MKWFLIILVFFLSVTVVKAVCVDPCAGNTSCGQCGNPNCPPAPPPPPPPSDPCAGNVNCGECGNPSCDNGGGGGGNPDPCAGNSNCGECGNGPCDGCFVAGTKVSLPNGTQKNIEDIKINDKVLSSENTTSNITSLVVKESNDVYQIKFENNKELMVTANHPIYTSDGWKAINPVAGAKDAPETTIGLLTTQDKVIDISGKSVAIASINHVPATFVVYSPAGVNPARNFYANDFLVHNKPAGDPPADPPPADPCADWCNCNCCWGCGGGGGCFVAGSTVSLADGTEKNVEDVSPKDSLLSRDPNGKNVFSQASSLWIQASSGVYKITFANKKELLLTSNHTVYTVDGWKAIDPVSGAKDAPKVKVGQLTVKDKMVDIKGNVVQIIDIQYVPAEFVVYSPVRVSPFENFYVNGFLVHNAEK